MAGRRPKPTHLKVVTGNPGKRPLNKREPHPTRGVPPCPKHLGERARKAWKKIAPELDRMGVLTLADGTALELLVDAYAEYWELREQVAAEGATYRNEVQDDDGNVSVQIKAHPAARLASDAWRRVRAMAIEFGLTPAARARVHADTDAPGDTDPWAELTGA